MITTYNINDDATCSVCGKSFKFKEEHKYIANGGHTCSWKCFLTHHNTHVKVKQKINVSSTPPANNSPIVFKNIDGNKVTNTKVKEEASKADVQKKLQPVTQVSKQAHTTTSNTAHKLQLF